MDHSQIALLCSNDRATSHSNLQGLAVQTNIPVDTLQAIFEADDANATPHNEQGPWWNTATPPEIANLRDIDAGEGY